MLGPEGRLSVMRLAVTTWSFPACTLDESVAIAAALSFDAVDLGYLHGPAIERARVLAESEAYGAEIGKLRLPVSCLFHRFGDSRADRNLADPACHDANLRDFRAALRFCRTAAIPLIMVLPGVVNPGQSAEAALAAASEALRAMTALAADAGIRVAVEPHVGALAATPEAVLDLVARVPGLGIVLDPAHFVCQGYDQAALTPLLAFAAHIHLRQARPGRLQAPHDAGTIDFGRLIADLHSVGYGGSLAIEYVHQPWMDTLHEDVLTETVRMRDLVRAWGNA